MMIRWSKFAFVECEQSLCDGVEFEKTGLSALSGSPCM